MYENKVYEERVNAGLRLGEYAITPLYNIKAVVQATGISPSTLRAWERRYNIARPQRSESGYRLYAERDVAVIRWLKAQVEAGMSISQAVSWLGTIVSEAGEVEQAVLPTTASGVPLQEPLPSSQSTYREQVRDFETLQQELVQALVNYNEHAAEVVMTEAFSMYPVELVGERLIVPVVQEIAHRRGQGELSSTTEHFSRYYLIQRMGALLRFIPNSTGGPLVWVICGRSEYNEVHALLLAIYLRRSGYRVHYLGQNLPTEEYAIRDFATEAERQQPAMLLFSLSSVQAVEDLGDLTVRLNQMRHDTLQIGYCGPIFNRKPELRTEISGHYLGATSQEVIHTMDKLQAKKLRQTQR